MSIADIDLRIKELDSHFQELFALSKKEGGRLKYADEFKRITEAIAEMEEKKDLILERQKKDSASNRRISDAVHVLNSSSEKSPSGMKVWSASW